VFFFHRRLFAALQPLRSKPQKASGFTPLGQDGVLPPLSNVVGKGDPANIFFFPHDFG